MSEMENHRPVATRELRKLEPPPGQRAWLEFREAYTSSEFEQVKAGLIPAEMEDKWFIFFEAPWLYLHRSWTGFCIYGVRFETTPDGVTAVESWVSRNADQYRETRDDHDADLLKFLIEALLLKRDVALPSPPRAPWSFTFDRSGAKPAEEDS